MPTPHPDTRDLIDVVNLVVQAVWAELRRSRRPIEPTQWATLRLIARGPCTVSELARHKAVSLPTMSKSVEMLVRRGWVERVANPSDRRQTRLGLTASGRRVLADSRRRFEVVLGRQLAGLTPDERAQVGAGLRSLRRVLDPDG